MTACNTAFAGTWSAEYLDEPEYSGEVEVKLLVGGVEVSGIIYKNGNRDGTWTGRAIYCDFPDGSHMHLIYTIEDLNGNHWEGKLDVAVFDYGDGRKHIHGYYDDDGNGDRGEITMRPTNSLDGRRRTPDGFFETQRGRK